jgi:hypothetical protein
MRFPSLVELQRAMTSQILGDDAPFPFEDWIRVPDGADPGTRFAVHRDGYPARIASSLAEAFPAVANILGEGSLAKLTDRFIRDGGSLERNLNRVGRSLPTFLESDSLTRELPFLPDLAALEWAVFECFHRATGGDFDASSVGAFSPDDWARARIVFRPGTAVVRSEWPIRELWNTRSLDRSEIDVDLSSRPERVLVYHVGFAIETQAIDAIEAHALERLLEYVQLGDVMSELAERGAEPDRVSGLFAHWTELGLLTECLSAVRI